MKCISIKQPWAGLIIAGIKTVENRSWSTKYSGPLAIAATAQPDPRAWFPMRAQLGKLPQACNVNGAIIGVCNLSALIWLADDGIPETDAVNLTISKQKIILKWWNPDSVGWILDNPRALRDPLPWKGRLGLYPLPPDILQKIERSF